MGKRVKKKVQWRRLSLSETATVSEEGQSHADFVSAPHKTNYKHREHNQRKHYGPPERYFNGPTDRYPHHEYYDDSCDPPPGFPVRRAQSSYRGLPRSYSEDDTQGYDEVDSFNSQPVHTVFFNNEAYTKIQTPRQEVIFKKSSLDKKRDSFDHDSTVPPDECLEEQSQEHGCGVPKPYPHVVTCDDPNHIYNGEPGGPPLAGLVVQQAFPGGPLIQIPVHWEPFIDPCFIPGDPALTTLDPLYTRIVDGDDLALKSTPILPLQHDANGCPITVHVQVDENGIPFEIEPRGFHVYQSSMDGRLQDAFLPPDAPLLQSKDKIASIIEETTDETQSTEQVDQQKNTDCDHKDADDSGSDSQYASMSDTSAPTSPASELAESSSDQTVCHSTESVKSEISQQSAESVSIESLPDISVPVTHIDTAATETLESSVLYMDDSVSVTDAIPEGEFIPVLSKKLRKATKKKNASRSASNAKDKLPVSINQEKTQPSVTASRKSNGAITKASRPSSTSEPKPKTTAEKKSAPQLTSDKSSKPQCNDKQKLKSEKSANVTSISQKTKTNDKTTRPKTVEKPLKKRKSKVSKVNEVTVSPFSGNTYSPSFKPTPLSLAAQKSMLPPITLLHPAEFCVEEYLKLQNSTGTDEVVDHIVPSEVSITPMEGFGHIDISQLDCSLSPTNEAQAEPQSQKKRKKRTKKGKSRDDSTTASSSSSRESASEASSLVPTDSEDATSHCCTETSNEENIDDVPQESQPQEETKPDIQVEEKTVFTPTENASLCHEEEIIQIAIVESIGETEAETERSSPQDRQVEDIPVEEIVEIGHVKKQIKLNPLSEEFSSRLPEFSRTISVETESVHHLDNNTEEHEMSSNGEPEGSVDSLQKTDDLPESGIEQNTSEESDEPTEETCKAGYVIVPILTPYYNPAVVYGYPMAMPEQEPMMEEGCSRRRRRKPKKRANDNNHPSRQYYDVDQYAGDTFIATPEGFMIPMESNPHLCQMHGYPSMAPYQSHINDEGFVSAENCPNDVKPNPYDTDSPKADDTFSKLQEHERQEIAEVLQETSKTVVNESGDSGVSESEDQKLPVKTVNSDPPKNIKKETNESKSKRKPQHKKINKNIIHIEEPDFSKPESFPFSVVAVIPDSDTEPVSRKTSIDKGKRPKKKTNKKTKAKKNKNQSTSQCTVAISPQVSVEESITEDVIQCTTHQPTNQMADMLSYDSDESEPIDDAILEELLLDELANKCATEPENASSLENPLSIAHEDSEPSLPAEEELVEELSDAETEERCESCTQSSETNIPSTIIEEEVVRCSELLTDMEVPSELGELSLQSSICESVHLSEDMFTLQKSSEEESEPELETEQPASTIQELELISAINESTAISSGPESETVSSTGVASSVPLEMEDSSLFNESEVASSLQEPEDTSSLLELEDASLLPEVESSLQNQIDSFLQQAGVESLMQESEAASLQQVPEADSSLQEPEAASTQSEVTSSLTEPEVTFSSQEPKAAFSLVEPEAVSSLVEPEAVSSLVEPEAAFSLVEQEAACPIQKPELASSLQEPEAASSLQEPEIASSQQDPDAVSSLIESEEVSALVESEAVSSLVESEAVSSLVEPEAAFSAVEQEPDCSLLEQEPDCSLLEQEAACSLVEQEAACPLVEQEAACLLLEQEAACSLVEKEATCSLLEPEAACSIQEPVVASSLQESDLASSLQEPELASSLQEPDAASSLQESEVSLSLQEQEIASTLKEPEAALSLQEPEVAFSLQESDLASSLLEPEVIISLQKPEVLPSLPKSDMESFHEEPEAASSQQDPESASLLQEPELASSAQELRVVESVLEVQLVAASLPEPEVTTSLPEVTTYLPEPEVTASVAELEVASSSPQPQVTILSQEPQVASSHEDITHISDSEPLAPKKTWVVDGEVTFVGLKSPKGADLEDDSHMANGCDKHTDDKESTSTFKELRVTEAVTRWMCEVTPAKAFNLSEELQSFLNTQNALAEDEEFEEVSFDELDQADFEQSKNVKSNPLAASPNNKGSGVSGDRVACESDANIKLETRVCSSRCESTISDLSVDCEEMNRNPHKYDPLFYSKYYSLGVEVDSTPQASERGSRSCSAERDCRTPLVCEWDENTGSRPSDEENLNHSMSLATEMTDVSLPSTLAQAPTGSDRPVLTLNHTNKDGINSPTSSSGLGSSLASTPFESPSRLLLGDSNECYVPHSSVSTKGTSLPCRTTSSCAIS